MSGPYRVVPANVIPGLYLVEGPDGPWRHLDDVYVRRGIYDVLVDRLRNRRPNHAMPLAEAQGVAAEMNGDSTIRERARRAR